MAQFRNSLKRCIPLLLALVVLISCLPAVSASAASTQQTIGITLLTGYKCSTVVGSSFTLTAAGAYFVSEKIPVQYGYTYSLDYYASAADYTLYFVGVDDNDIVTEFHEIKPGAVGSFTKEWTPTAESTTSLVLRGYTVYTSQGITELVVLQSPEENVDELVTYGVYLDDACILSPSFDVSSVSVMLDVYEDYFRIYFDGFEETYYHREDYTSNDYQFAGLSLSDPALNVVDYEPASRYELTLTSSSPKLVLYSVLWPVVYVDPNGGTWNGNSGVSTWAAPLDDGGPVADPVRDGYLFDGWTFSGEGTLKESSTNGSSYVYTFGDGAGYLTANWVANSVADPDVFTSTITIDGEVFTFSAEDASPDLTLAVTETGCTITDGSTTQTWTYSGTGSFAGLSLTEGGNVSFAVGSTASCDGTVGANTSFVLYSASDAASSSYTLSAGQWECNSLVMTGEYVDLTAWPDGLTAVDLSFISGGTTFSGMKYQYDVGLGYRLYYGDTLAYDYDTISPTSAPSWMSNAYALVYLAADQTVSEAFYNWFTSCFTRTGSDPVDPVYTTTINIYDMTGISLLATWSAASPGTCPSFTFSVLDNGILVSSDESWSWTGAGDPFYGFSMSAGSSSPAFAPGEVSSFTGSNADFTLSLYVVSELADKVYQTGVLGWLQKLFDIITELPELIRNAIFGEDVLNAVSEASTGLNSLSLFRAAFQSLYAGFGLVDLFEDPAGPFYWLNG